VNEPQTVLVTGPSGVVGAPLLDRLDPALTICLSHQAAAPRSDVRVVRGDVSRRRLGLDPDAYEQLAREVDVVVHCAAATRFDIPREETFAINLDGTAHVLELVADSGARLLHLSTAFVVVPNGTSSGWVDPGHYLDSKRASEALVRDSGLDWHIVRPSVVIGDSETGEAARLQGFHFFMRALLSDQLPLLPVEEGDMGDFVSADLVADVLAAMVEKPPPGDVSSITAGERAYTARHAVERAIDIAERNGQEVPPPRLVDPEMVDRLIRPVFFPELPKRIVRRYDQVTALATIVVTSQPFESSLPELEHHYGREFELDLDRTFERSIEFLLGTLAKPVEAA
jgi:nucleoside-diphosphate-sugar epimerase